MPERTALSAQEEREDADALLRRLRQIQSNPVLRRLFEDREDLTPAQKRIISQAVDAMSPEEVDENLTLMELSTDGSIYTRRERLKIALGVGTTPSLPPSPLPPEIAIENASEGEYIEGSDDQRGLLKLSGRIRVRLPNGVFYADRVIVDTARQEIYGEGDIVYLENDTEVRAERIIYNRKLNIGIVYNTEGQVGPIHFIGRTIKQVDEDHFAVSQAFFHTCSAETPHYNFTASKLYIYDDNKIFATGVWYHIGGVPMLPLPFLFASDWGTGIITQVGYSDVQGWFMENTYQFGVPDAIYSSWQPMAYRFKFDYHQKIGEMLGIEMYRFAPGLSYVFDIGGARYKRYEVVGDYREKDRIAITNNVLRDDGTTGRIEDNWHKIFALINFRQQDLTDNNVRNVQLRFEDYGHFLYEYEFGGRYVPESTIPALYKNSEAGRGLLRTNTNWNLVYNEVRDDLRIRVSATRNRYWDVNVDFFEDSEYVPQNDVAPSIDIEKRWRVGDVPYLDLPVYWDHTLHSDLQREYSLGKDFKNINNNKYQTGLRTYIPIIPYVSLAPTIGYGLQKSVPQLDTTDASQEEALITEGKKNSYQYVFTEDELVLGPPELFLSLIYRKKSSFKEEQNDAPSVNLTGFTGNQKVNETEITLQAMPFVDALFSLNTIYDHREFERDVPTRERWYYPVFRSDVYFDFLNLFDEKRENLLSRHKVHFVGLRLTNDYIYDPINKRDHSDVVGLSLEMGGFDLWLLKRLRYFEASFYWYHVYYNPELDHLRFAFKMDVQLWSWGYLEMEMESRATDVERYSGDSLDENGDPDHVNFTRDIANGAGFNGRRNREDAVFNVAYFKTALVLDLHDWEYRLGYELEQRALFGGVNSLEVVNYYDNRVFFSVTLLRYDLGSGVADGSRFLIDRQRVRPSEIGRQPIGQERLY